MKKYLWYVSALSILEIGASLYLTYWRADFWGAVSTRNYHNFTIELAIFVVVALLLCAVSSLATYFLSLSAIKWREKLNSKAQEVEKHHTLTENFSQRVQSDCQEYPDLLLSLIFGLGKALVYIITFSVALIIGFSAWYLTIIILYAIISTLIAQKIAKPLISLNYKSQVAEATYRNDLSISNFQIAISIMLGLATKTKYLNYFQTFYSQVAVVLPIIIVAPAYFGGALTLGLLMQATSTLGTISDNCSFGISSFGQINRFLSCRKRLLEIGVI